MSLDQSKGSGRKLLRPADLPDTFTRSLYKIAPYRGCGHGCRYCDGRAERYYVEGDFERDIEIRDSIPDRLERELPGLREIGIVGFGSGVTDPYQPIEASEDISGRCARILAEAPIPLPAMVMTKSALPLRDLEAWSRVNERAGFILLVSITSLDEELRSLMEPGAACFTDRLHLLRAYKEAGCVTGALAMPFLPGISDSPESIAALYDACISAGVDFIMPGGLTLRPGRQKQLYLSVIKKYFPSIYSSTLALFSEDRPSGSPSHVACTALNDTTSQIQKDFGIPFLLPYSCYEKILPSHDAFHILFRDMVELYEARGIDTAPLRRSADRFDEWLINLRRVFRKKRSFPIEWLEERFKDAISSGEIHRVLENPRLEAFVLSIVNEDSVFDYKTLRLVDRK